MMAWTTLYLMYWSSKFGITLKIELKTISSTWDLDMGLLVCSLTSFSRGEIGYSVVDVCGRAGGQESSITPTVFSLIIQKMFSDKLGVVVPHFKRSRHFKYL